MLKFWSHCLKKSPRALILLFLLILYLLTAPLTTQFGDTGELVTNGYLLRVSHPSGYPLFTLLIYLITHVISFSTIFFRASLLQIVFSLISLFIVLKISKKEKILDLFLVLSLGVSDIYWRYSILPDVFMFNVFFVASFSYYYFEEASNKNFQRMCLILGVALLNHLTVIFLIPLLVSYFFFYRSKIKLITNLLILLAPLLGYSLLLLFDDQSLGSWGKVSHWEDILRMITRADYGTFILDRSLRDDTYLWENVVLMGKYLSTDYYYFLAIAGALAITWRVKLIVMYQKDVIYFLSIAIYVGIFFSLANVIPLGANEELVKRFYVMPFAMLTICSIRLSQLITVKKYINICTIICLVNFLSNTISNFDYNNFRLDRFMENHYRYLLQSLPKDSIYLSVGDTSLFNLYYIQEVLNIRKDVMVVSPDMYSGEWYREKLKKAYPTKKLNNEPLTAKYFQNANNLIISPNIESSPIFIDSYLLHMLDYSKYHVIHKGIAVEVKLGQGPPRFECPTNFPRTFDRNYKKYNMTYEVFHWYGTCDFLAADFYFKQKNYLLAYDYIKNAVDKVPYSLNYQKAKCDIIEMINSQTSMKKNCESDLKNKSHNYLYPYLLDEGGQ